MYHIPEITPEISTIDVAFKDGEFEEKIDIGENVLKRIYEKISYALNSNADFVYLECHYYNIQEVKKAACLMEGKNVKKVYGQRQIRGHAKRLK